MIEVVIRLNLMLNNLGTGYYVHAAQNDATKASTVEVMNQFIQNELK